MKAYHENDPGATSAREKDPAPPVRASAAADTVAARCGRCGSTAEADARYCVECGDFIGPPARTRPGGAGAKRRPQDTEATIRRPAALGHGTSTSPSAVVSPLPPTRHRGKVAAMAAGCGLLLAGAATAAYLALSAAEPSRHTTVVADDPSAPEEIDAPAVTPSAGVPPSPSDSSVPAREDAAAPADDLPQQEMETPGAAPSTPATEPGAPPPDATRRIAGTGYELLVPKGPGWRLGRERTANGGLLLSRRLTGPNGIVIRIVHVPKTRAQPDPSTIVADDELVGAAVADARRMTLQDFPTPECRGIACDDFVLNDPSFGGIAILANGTGSDPAAGVAEDIARSVGPS